jgi:hypothetical protein
MALVAIIEHRAGVLSEKVLPIQPDRDDGRAKFLANGDVGFRNRLLSLRRVLSCPSHVEHRLGTDLLDCLAKRRTFSGMRWAFFAGKVCCSCSTT